MSFCFQNMLRVIVCACLVANIMVSSCVNAQSDLSKLTSDYASGSDDGGKQKLPSDNVAPGRDSKSTRESRSADQGFVRHNYAPMMPW